MRFVIEQKSVGAESALLEEIFKIWAKPDVIEMINEVGEIENPIPLGTKMLKEIPEFRKLAGKAIKAVLWS